MRTLLRDRRSLLILLVLLLLAASGLRLHQGGTLGTQADEGIHITVAERVAFSDDAVYRDLFENRTPGVEWLLAALFRLTGPSIFAGRVLSVSMATLTVAGVFVAARETVLALAGTKESSVAPLSGLLAGSLFALAPLPLFWARYTMMEHFATAAATLSVALTMRALNRRRSRLWALAGLLAASAIVFKQTELILPGAVGFFFILLFFSDRRAHLKVAVPSWIAGLGLGIGAFLALLLIQGTLNDFLQLLSGADRLAPLANWQQKGHTLWQWTWRRPHVVLILPALLLWLRHRSPFLSLAAGWSAVALLSLLLPPQLDLSPGGFSHYVVTPIAALSILGGSTIGWLILKCHNGYTKIIALLAIVLVLITLPGWVGDLNAAVSESDYPQPDRTAEQEIGRAAAMLTAGAEREPILVLGNSVFYHWAQRAPASRFFHFPAYFTNSPIGRAAIAEWTALISERKMDAVIISRLHLQERLPDGLQAALWTNWTPVALFPYPYQRDALLFRPAAPIEQSEPLVNFGDIRLLEARIEALDQNTFLLKLVWQPLDTPQADYTVFVHVRDAQGQLVTQADGVPVVGFRPTSTWQAQEVVVDYHWITLPTGVEAATSSLNVGLYHAATSERLPANAQQSDLTVRDQSLIIPLRP